MDELHFDPATEADPEVVGLVSRYEHMLHAQHSDYFEEEEYEMIIDYYLQQNAPQSAMEVADRGSAVFPMSSELKLRKADMLIVDGAAGQAMQLLESIEPFELQNTDLFFLKARAAIQMDQRENALIFFDEAVRLSENNEDTDEQIEILHVAAEDFLLRQDYESATMYLRQAEAIEPKNTAMLNDMAFCLERMDKLEESVVYYEQYLDEQPFNDNVWYNLGTIYGRLASFDKAIEAFDYALAINKESSSALYNKAIILLNAERYKESAEAFAAFLLMEPGNLYAICSLGECYHQQDMFAEAGEQFNRALLYDDEYADAHYGLANLLMETEEWGLARKHIERALEKDEMQADFWQTLAEIQEIQGDIAGALTSLRCAVMLDPQDEESLAKLNFLTLNGTV